MFFLANNEFKYFSKLNEFIKLIEEKLYIY